MKKTAAPSMAPKLSLADIRERLFPEGMTYDEDKDHYQNLPNIFIGFAHDCGVNVNKPLPALHAFLEKTLDALEGKDLALLGGSVTYETPLHVFAFMRLGVLVCRAAIKQRDAAGGGEAYAALAERALNHVQNIHERIETGPEAVVGVLGNLTVVHFEALVNLRPYKFGVRHFTDSFVDCSASLFEQSPPVFAQTLAMLASSADDQGLALLQQVFARAFLPLQTVSAEHFEANVLAFNSPFLAPIAEENLHRLFEACAAEYDGNASIKKAYDHMLTLWRKEPRYAQALAIGEQALETRFDPPADRPVMPPYLRQFYTNDAQAVCTMH